jgi:hypothetical protein
MFKFKPAPENRTKRPAVTILVDRKTAEAWVEKN